MTESSRSIVNIADVDCEILKSPNGTFEAELARLGPLVGAKKLGAMLTILEPGNRAFPFHAHHAIEEMFFILDGEGTYRCGSVSFPICRGDLIAAPASGANHAHQIVNTSDRQLRFLAISTMDPVDIVEYPDSGKVRLYAKGDSEDLADARLNLVAHRGAAVDLYEDE